MFDQSQCAYFALINFRSPVPQLYGAGAREFRKDSEVHDWK